VLPEVSASTAFTEEWLAQFAKRLEPVSHALIAVSGGPDSLALLDLVRRQPALRVMAATVDHGLRIEARQECALVAELCAAWRIPHHTLTIPVDAPERGVQEWARQQRYALLAALAKQAGCDALVVAHHQDDQAETLLHRLAAGSGPAGLAGMKLRSRLNGLLVLRPLLDVPKSALVVHCQANGIPFIADESNANPRFLRARLRQARLVLDQEGLTSARLATFAQRMQRINDALETRVNQVWQLAIRPCGSVDWAQARSEPEEIRLRVLKRGIDAVRQAQGLSVPLSLERLETLMLAVDHAFGQRKLARTLGGLTVTLDRSGLLRFAPEPQRHRGRKAV
jgi:tRNA(Ile)-lysidine synthase